MQPPPRKVKHSGVVKHVHADQTTKLNQKHQQESDLIEDIRLFSQKRAQIEKEYAQALCKLAQQFLTKRQFPPPPELPTADGQEAKTVMTVWKTVLDETDRVGRMRLQAADAYHHEIHESCKPLKTQKAQMAKKVTEQAVVLQKEVSQVVHDLVQAQKVYNAEEHVAHEARVKANEANAKLQKKSVGLFTSRSSLQKTSQKLNAKRDAVEVKATTARNDYILSLATANAQQQRYYNVDLPELIKLLDNEMYDKLRDFFIVMARTELECCGLTQECFTKIMSDAALVSRQYNLECFLHDNKSFTDLIEYDFEAVDGDEVRTVSLDYQGDRQCQHEIQRLADRMARDNKIISINQKRLEYLEDCLKTGRKPSESTSGDEKKPEKGKDKEIELTTEQQIDECKALIRQAESSKTRAQARVECLTLAGVETDAYIAKAQAKVQAEVDEELNFNYRSESPTSNKTDSSEQRTSQTGSGADDKGSTGGERSSVSIPNDGAYVNYEEDDFVDDTFEATEGARAAVGDVDSITYSSGRVFPISCIALYDFQSSNRDELSLKEGQCIQLVGDGDGDGWVRAQSDDGSVGLIPENYIQVLEDSQNGGVTESQSTGCNSVPQSAGYDSVPQSAGYDSVPQSAGYESSYTDSAGYESSGQSAGYDSSAQNFSYNGGSSEVQYRVEPPVNEEPEGRVSAYSENDYEVQKTMHMEEVEIPSDGCLYARALYQYEATAVEELAFQEGQLIKILRKEINGIDDGWWEGEVDGKTGVFPSLVVEEINPTNGQYFYGYHVNTQDGDFDDNAESFI